MALAKARQPRAFSRVSISLIPSSPTGPRYWAGASPYCAQARSRHYCVLVSIELSKIEVQTGVSFTLVNGQFHLNNLCFRDFLATRRCVLDHFPGFNPKDYGIRQWSAARAKTW